MIAFALQDHHNLDEDAAEKIKRECERIFHPERFELHDLTTSLPTLETPNIDMGAFFYAQQQQNASEAEPNWRRQQEQTFEEGKRVTFDDIKDDDDSHFQRYRKYGRSFSTQDASPTSLSSMRRTSTTVGSLENLRGHNEASYPHFHHVLSRKRPSMTIEKEKPRAGKLITEGLVGLPTIEDVEDVISSPVVSFQVEK